MSDQQYTHFISDLRPLDEKQLAYMRKQSSQARIDDRELIHHGDFRGKTLQMLRRGFCSYMHFNASGARRLMFRLPAGLPCSAKRFAAFQPDCGVIWHEDKPSAPAKVKGMRDKPSPGDFVAAPLRRPLLRTVPGERKRGGILEISTQAQDRSAIDQIDPRVPRLYQLAVAHNMLIAGDLRPLYVAWLACNRDEEALEPPVPAGLGNNNGVLDAMANFYGIQPGLIEAAARRSPAIAEPNDHDNIEKWIAQRSAKDLRNVVRTFLSDWTGAILNTVIRIRNEVHYAWPLAKPTRTLAELRALAGRLQPRRAARENKSAKPARRKQPASCYSRVG
jgi:hypothetical protein